MTFPLVIYEVPHPLLDDEGYLLYFTTIAIATAQRVRF